MAQSTTRRVLIVEDDEDLREILGALVSVLGYEAEKTSNGAEALRCAEGHPPDVVLIDIGLPDIDGFEVARRIRRMTGAAGATLVALTGYSAAAERALARDAGFDEYLVKPAAPAALKRIIEIHLPKAQKTASRDLKTEAGT